MTVNEALRDAARKLQPKKITCAADKNLGRLEAEILLERAATRDRVWLLTNPRTPLSKSVARLFETLVRRRTKHEPIAYILGEKEFYGQTFRVTKDVLIPRPDTELMVESAVRGNVFWDVGTGSGAIACSLASKFPEAKILATDISLRALAVAKINAKRLHAKQITFLKSDLLQPATYQWLKKQTDRTGRGHAFAPTLTICANLPYLPISDAKKIDPDVAKFEPKRALYSGKDGLVLITKFLKQLSRHLPEWNYSDVTLLFEFDPPQAAALQRLATQLFADARISIKKDLAGRNRVLLIRSIPKLG